MSLIIKIFLALLKLYKYNLLAKNVHPFNNVISKVENQSKSTFGNCETFKNSFKKLEA